MLQLTMATCYPYNTPAVSFQQPKNISNFHVAMAMRNTASMEQHKPMLHTG
jgi:hypothetical protein